MFISDARDMKAAWSNVSSGTAKAVLATANNNSTDCTGNAIKISEVEADADKVTVEISEEAKDKLRAEKQREKQMSQADIDSIRDELERMKESAEAAEKGFKELSKIMEIARRIARGDKVPMKDEQKLMEYDNDLYQACKAAAMLARNRKRKEYDSMFEDEEDDIKDKVRELDNECESGPVDAEIPKTEAAADMGGELSDE